jgi:hypothetical protein
MNSSDASSNASEVSILEDVSYSSQQKFMNSSDTSSNASEVSYKEEEQQSTETEKSPLLVEKVNTFGAHGKQKNL